MSEQEAIDEPHEAEADLDVIQEKSEEVFEVDDDSVIKAEAYKIDEDEEFEGEGESEEEEAEELKEAKVSDDDLDDWYVPSYQSLEGEKYGELFYEGEEEGEEVGEEEILSPVPSAEKLVAEPRPAEYDHVFDELHPEVDDDREEVIDRLRDLHTELAELKHKNKLLEVWVFRCMKKMEQKMTRPDPTKSREDMEELYKEELRVYKMKMDDIQSRQNELLFEMQNYMKKVESIRTETGQSFRELLNREKEVAVDLIFEKTGKKVTEKMMNTLTRRQIACSRVLAESRRRFIVLKHYLEDLRARLKSVETLGEGMTTMDYEALHVANIGYKDKLDERDQELEKLRIIIAKTVNGVAQYKEKEVCLAEDIGVEEARLKLRRSKTTRIRERVNNSRMKLKALRDDFNEKKIEAGLLVALPELMEMERKMGMRDNLKKEIDTLEREIKLYKEAKLQKERSSKLRSKNSKPPATVHDSITME